MTLAQAKQKILDLKHEISQLQRDVIDNKLRNKKLITELRQALAMHDHRPGAAKQKFKYRVRLICGDGSKRWFDSVEISERDAESQATELRGLGYEVKVEAV